MVGSGDHAGKPSIPGRPTVGQEPTAFAVGGLCVVLDIFFLVYIFSCLGDGSI